MITCIIPTKYRYNDLIETIESIYAQNNVNFEILVLDSNNDTNLSERIKKYCDNFDNIFYYKDNFKSACHARNFGIKKAKYEYIALLDDDVILDKNYLINGINSLMKYNVDGVTGVTINSKFSRIARLFYIGEFKDPRVEKLNKPKKTKYLSSGNSIIKKHVFNYYKFDEFYEGYSFAEDIDFSYRASKDFSFLVDPTVKMIHKSSPIGRVNILDYEKLKILGLSYFYFKNIYPKQKTAFVMRLIPILLKNKNHFFNFLKLIIKIFNIKDNIIRIKFIQEEYLKVQKNECYNRK